VGRSRAVGHVKREHWRVVSKVTSQDQRGAGAMVVVLVVLETKHRGPSGFFQAVASLGVGRLFVWTTAGRQIGREYFGLRDSVRGSQGLSSSTVQAVSIGTRACMLSGKASILPFSPQTGGP
jgi:hypothetical protein